MAFDDIFKPDPKRDARILDSIYPSDFFPKRGEYFRVRSATIADRSFMGDIWLCIESQDHCAVGKKVLDTYLGLRPAAPSDLLSGVGSVRAFVAGDVIFYDCTKIWAVVEEERGDPKVQPAQPEGAEVHE